jgi:hypothetical protein
VWIPGEKTSMCARLAELAQAGEMRKEQVSLVKMY